MNVKKMCSLAININRILLLLSISASPALAALSNSDLQQIPPRQNLLNSNFQNGKVSWTVSAGTFTIDTTNVFDGAASGLVTASSQQSTLTQDVPTNQYASVSLEAMCFVKTTLTNVQVSARAGGLTQVSAPVPSSGTWQPVIVNFTGPANGTSIGIQVAMTSSGTGTFNIGSCYVGPSTNLGSGTFTTPWVLETRLTPSAGFGTTTGSTFFSRRNGANYEVYGFINSSSPTASTASIALPSGYTINPSGVTAFAKYKFGDADWFTPSSTITLAPIAIFYDGTDTTSLYFSIQSGTAGYNKANGNALDPLIIRLSVPISQFTDQPFYTPTSTPASWSGYQTVSSGWTTASSGSFADFSAGSGIALTSTTTRNITCSSAGSSLAGVACNLARSGIHHIEAVVSFSDGNNETPSLRLVDGSGTIIDPGRSLTVSSTGIYNMTLSGDYIVTSNSSPLTFKVQGQSQGGTISVRNGAASGTASIQWVITEKDSPTTAPYIIGLPTSTFYTGTMANTESWSTSSTSFVDPTNSGGNTLVAVGTPTMTVTAAASNKAGITFTPDSAQSIYLIKAMTIAYNTVANDGIALRLYDGTNAFGWAGSNAATSSGYPTPVEGIYTPGTASAVTVTLQASIANSAGGTAMINGNPGSNLTGSNVPTIQWTVIKIR